MLRDKSVSEGDIKSWQSGLPDFATENADVRAKFEYAEKIGADWYAKDAKRSADIAKEFFGV